jgi:hypothetical protein
MPSVRFEPVTPAVKQLQTYILNCMAMGIGTMKYTVCMYPITVQAIPYLHRYVACSVVCTAIDNRLVDQGILV